VAPWLSSSTRDSTLLLAPAAAATGCEPRSRADDAGVDAQCYAGQRVRFLPLDGPGPTVERVVRGLRSRLPDRPTPWIIPRTPTDGPPSPSVLELLRLNGLHPGVDLRDTTWVDSDSILWTDPEAVTRLAIRAADPSQARRAASIVGSLRGLDPRSPAGAWIAACALGQPASQAEWEAVLTAQYIGTVAHASGAGPV
jgi:hypothetical protein